ncbi:leucyl/phenylalanyl-tRNA--protein transferase [Ferrithrix thermotolerans DSM 19514]|jgi:leucyl/phenylalanyl-tRNA--protein transferase|uniref:Leucyl/phenylalanyl-tRNA--protein transferase n=1 Tax=Ferrithrix thermotolerans DSM 19514 TaxID=1121881 RepID=A0A1M4TD96_9ACTN|nr:leucyl/phenylalanyl-tRNA--protein transferase [Ferrithrix thermotolerans DSM 19514]
MRDLGYHYGLVSKLQGTDFLPTIDETLIYLQNDPSMDDLLYVGGSITPKSLIAGYTKGVFPMRIGDEEEEFIGWFSPCTRAIMHLHPEKTDLQIKIPKSLRKEIRRLVVRTDTRFSDVLRLCASIRSEGNWIDEEYIKVYESLFEAGYAHSYEVYDSSNDNELVGGLFGIGVGQLFSGESMFHITPNASKVAFVYLVQDLRAKGFKILDGQWPTHHLRSLGMTEMPRDEYLTLLKEIFNPNNPLY